MSRRFLIATVGLTATVAFLVGLIVAGSTMPARAVSSTPAVSDVPGPAAQPVSSPSVSAPGAASFADVAEQLNPAVVNIDATSRSDAGARRRFTLPIPDRPDLFDRPSERGRDELRKGTGTGFVIDPDGYILTNHHVIDGADRVVVRLLDGRSFRARTVGSDPDTDIALIKVESASALAFAPLGDSDRLRVGEWVCAIGNPLAYEHTVTVGVVSFIGRKLFDTSLDHYIQTDAAINFGNSGGPLINSSGEVVGINAAISSRASSIGFAVPINQAREILPQLREKGRVARGYIGATLKDVDADLQRSLGLSTARGALVQDVAAGSPGSRAGMRIYDVIVAVDGKTVTGNDALIRDIASRTPGTTTVLQVVRDGRPMTIAIKLAERPARERRSLSGSDTPSSQPAGQQAPSLGIMVRDMDQDFVSRFNVPGDVHGVIVSRVEPMSAAFDADIERGYVILEVNRHPIATVDDYRRLAARTRAGDVLAFYVYSPESQQRQLRTVRVEER